MSPRSRSELATSSNLFCRRAAAPASRRAHWHPCRLQVRAGGLPPLAGRFLDAPQRPAEPAQRHHLLSFLDAQDVGHPGEGPCPPAVVNVSSPSAPLAGFQPSITGRFCPSAEGRGRWACRMPRPPGRRRRAIVLARKSRAQVPPSSATVPTRRDHRDYAALPTTPCCCKPNRTCSRVASRGISGGAAYASDVRFAAWLSAARTTTARSRATAPRPPRSSTPWWRAPSTPASSPPRTSTLPPSPPCAASASLCRTNSPRPPEPILATSPCSRLARRVPTKRRTRSLVIAEAT